MVEPAKDPNDLESGDKKLELMYDYMGRRVEKKVYTHDGSSWGTPSYTRFIYHNWLLLAEYEVTDPGDPGEALSLLRKYTWGLDLAGQSRDREGAGIDAVGGVGGLLGVRDVTGSNAYSYFYDANGNVGQLLQRVTPACRSAD